MYGQPCGRAVPGAARVHELISDTSCPESTSSASTCCRARPPNIRRDILSRFFSQAAGRPIRSVMVSSHQTFREFGVWHPHGYRIVRE